MPEKPPIFEKEEEINPREKLAADIRGVLRRENFSVNLRLKEYFADEIENTNRFVSIPGHYKEGDQRKEGFLKIPVERELDELFKNQVEMTDFIKKDGHLNIRGVVKANTERSEGLPYAIFETFEESDARIGYISSYEGGELLGEKEAEGTVAVIQNLHEADLSKMPTELLEGLRKFPGTYEECFNQIMSVIDKKVKPLDRPAGKKKESLHEVLGRRFGAENYKEKVIELLERWKDMIGASEGGKPMMVHGDLGPGNIYVHNSGEIEPVDYEHAGVCANEIVATVVDYGNFRARAWNNSEFRGALDKAMIEHYKTQNREEVGKAIVSLGILWSDMKLAGYFEDYPARKQREPEQAQRREATEADLVSAWEVAGLKL